MVWNMDHCEGSLGIVGVKGNQDRRKPLTSDHGNAFVGEGVKELAFLAQAFCAASSVGMLTQLVDLTESVHHWRGGALAHGEVPAF